MTSALTGLEQELHAALQDPDVGTATRKTDGRRSKFSLQTFLGAVVHSIMRARFRQHLDTSSQVRQQLRLQLRGLVHKDRGMMTDAPGLGVWAYPATWDHHTSLAQDILQNWNDNLQQQQQQGAAGPSQQPQQQQQPPQGAPGPSQQPPQQQQQQQGAPGPSQQPPQQQQQGAPGLSQQLAVVQLLDIMAGQLSKGYAAHYASELDMLRGQVRTLRNEKTTLQLQAQQRNAQLAELEAQKADLEQRLKLLLDQQELGHNGLNMVFPQDDVQDDDVLMHVHNTFCNDNGPVDFPEDGADPPLQGCAAAGQHPPAAAAAAPSAGWPPADPDLDQFVGGGDQAMQEDDLSLSTVGESIQGHLGVHDEQGVVDQPPPPQHQQQQQEAP